MANVSRRSLLTGALAGAAVLPGVAGAVSTPDDENWRSFKTRFVTEDGRVIDNANRGVSHSEGQGWGLLFAAAFDDRDCFDRMIAWTDAKLRRPHDALHAWRFVPTDQPPVKDLNNATDGDIFIAAALARAGRQWGNLDHLRAAIGITHDILALATHEVGQYLVLMPAVMGFEDEKAIIVNPSYYAFPFFTELARLVPSQQWNRLERDGIQLIEQGRFGTWQLPPDWLRVARNGQQLAPAPGWPPRFSFDAIRIPLWSTWHNLPIGPVRLAMNHYWSAFPDDTFPAWVDVVTGAVAPYPASAGIVAVARLTRIAIGAVRSSELPKVGDAHTYYDASLILLSRLAWRDLRLG
jgi:endoglucanase